MDAAEESIRTRGFQASTMEVIARDAGYSRGGIYRQFTNKQHLVEALVERATGRCIASIFARLAPDAGPVDALVESLVIVATELVSDPLLKTVSEESESGTVAQLVANHSGLEQILERLVDEVVRDPDRSPFRRGLNSRDLCQFLIITSVTFLLEIVPGIDDPDTARRYITTFVLPAVVDHPPEPTAVFADTD